MRLGSALSASFAWRGWLILAGLLLLGLPSLPAWAQRPESPEPAPPAPSSRIPEKRVPGAAIVRPSAPTPAVARGLRIGDDASDPAIEQALREARALMTGGKVDEGLQKLRDLVQQHPDDQRLFLLYGSALEGTGRKEEALRFYREAADRMKDPGLPLASLERLYRMSQDWKSALDVCMEYMKRVGEEDQGWVADELESLVREDGVGPEAVRALEEARKRRPDDDRLRELYVQALLHEGKIDKALEEASALDAERHAKGATLYSLASLAEQKGDAEAALAGYERALRAAGDGELKAKILLGRAEALRKLRRIPESLSALDEAIAAARGQARLEAQLTKAEIEDGEQRKPDEAVRIYQEILDPKNADVSPDRRDEVRLLLANSQLKLGRPSDAAETYRVLADSAADPKTRAEALYQTGEMLLFQGKLKEAEDTYYKLTDDFRGQPRVNDALERILLLGEKSDEGGLPVVALAQAQYQERMGAYEKGLGIVQDALNAHPKCGAADNLWMEQVNLLLGLGRTPEALTAADTLGARFPDSPLASRSLWAVAQRLLETPEGESKGMAVCMDILTRFPDSIEAPEVRAALARAREKSRASS